MATNHTEWKTLAHGPIEKLADNVWRVVGALPNGPLKRVMTVVRMADGGLLLHSVIALDEATMPELEALGRPAVMVVPNGFHRIDAPRYKARYPQLKVFCPRAATADVASRVHVDGDYSAIPQDATLTAAHFDGTHDREGVLTVRSADGVTVVLNDILFNADDAPGFTGFVFKHITASTGGPKVSRIAKLFLVKDRAAVKAQFEQLAALEGLKRVVVSHDRVITDDPAGTLRAVAAAL